MSTPYASALHLVGLSQEQAATFHAVSVHTVKSWSAGRRPVPDGVWDELRALWARQTEAAAQGLQRRISARAEPAGRQHVDARCMLENKP